MAYHNSQAIAQRWPEINPNSSGMTPQMPLVVVMGVDAVGQLKKAAKPSAEAQQQYGEDPRQALWAWTRSAARTLSCCAADCTPQPRAAVSTSASAADLPNVSESEEPSADAATRAATHLQSDMDSRNAACYFPMAQRAMVLRSKVTIRTAGGEYEARLEELEESEEDGYDDEEALVEPLRQSGAQAVVSKTIRRPRPGALDQYEQQVISHTLWDPSEVASQYIMRSIHEVQHMQPWCSMLQPELLGRTAAAEDPEIVRKHKHSLHYLPTIEDIRRLRAVQCAHTQKILEVISPQDAYRLGFHDLSADKAVTEWAAKHGQGTVHHLEGGLANKVEGLESVRREKLPSSRMYQLSEYYYKVWRTLHTPEAQTHYMNKCKEKRADLLKKEQARARQDNRMRGQNQSQPMRQYSSNANLAPGLSEPAGDIANGNIAHASNAGSAISSPRFGAAGRNVRPRMDQWAGAGGTQMDAGFHTSQLATHMNAADNHLVHG